MATLPWEPGLIGKSQHENYRVRTPIATVGIRGTHYNLVVCQQDCFESDGSLAADGNYGGVLEGRLAIANKAGEREFGVDEYFYVADANTIPQTLRGRPGFLRDRLEARRRREDQREALARASGGTDDARQSKAAVALVVASAARINTAALNTLNSGLAKAGATISVTELRDEFGMRRWHGLAFGSRRPAPQHDFIVSHVLSQRRQVFAAVLTFVFESRTQQRIVEPLPSHRQRCQVPIRRPGNAGVGVVFVAMTRRTAGVCKA